MVVALEKRLQLIKPFPCFAQFTSDQYAELAALMEEKEYKPQEIIVAENDIVDSVHILVEGEAEVTRAEKRRKKIIQVPLAILHGGEAIGLNDSGFYSATGKRTATVTTVTSIVTLRLDIKNLYDFLQKHHLELKMHEASLQMLRMKLIKQSLPFAKISHERLQWLAERVEELKLFTGDILFKEGDVGDKCYLIRSGKIEIITQQNGETHQLAILRPPALFGEATMITRAPRNATTRAMEETELFVLHHKYLTELIETEEQVSNMFMTLMLDRSRPMQNDKVTVHHRVTADGQALTILKNPENGSYFKLSKEGHFIWQHLDGNHTVQEITLGMADKFQLFAPNVVAGLISKLTKSGFVTNVDINLEPSKSSEALWVKAMRLGQQLLDKRISFNNSDCWITTSYQKFVRYFFTRTGKIIAGLFIVIGLTALFCSTNDILTFFTAHKVSMLLVLIVYPLSMLDIAFHELAHAYAVKAAGREVRYIGLGWSFAGPVAFTDTSDMWLSSRKERMAVNVAGVYADAIFAAFCGVLIFVVLNPYIQGLLWIIGIFTCVSAFRQLSPMQEYDGYYVLMDWVEKNRLRQHAVIWLVKKFPKCLRKPSLFKEDKPEVYYWLACLVYLVLVSIITLLLQFFVLKALGMAASNPYLTLLLPLTTMIFSAVGIVAEVKSQKDE